jgi:hypothetical protein
LELKAIGCAGCLIDATLLLHLLLRLHLLLLLSLHAPLHTHHRLCPCIPSLLLLMMMPICCLCTQPQFNIHL